MADYFLVEHVRGPAWDPGRGRRDQAGWDEHARFMDQLADEGIVLLGGPVGDVNGEKSVLVCKVTSESDIRARLARDPWAGTILTVASVQPWSIWLRAKAGA